MDTTELTQKMGVEVMNLVEVMVGIMTEHDLENIDIGITGIAVEVTATSDGEKGTGIMTQCTDPRAWVQAAFFGAAARNPIADIVDGS